MDMEQYKLIIAGRDHMLGELSSGRSRWTACACICAVKEGSKPVVSTNQACHAGLSQFNTGSLAIVSALMKPGRDMLDEDEALLFLDWLLNRSPYSQVFITKSAHEALLHKAIVTRTDVPSNLMAAGLVASRRLWEYQEVARVFCDLVKAGVDEDLAFWLGHIARVSFNRSGNADWNGVRNGHCSMDSRSFNAAGMRNWLSHKPTSLNALYKDKVTYYGYASMFGHGDGLDTWVHNNFPYTKGVKSANPFPMDRAVGDPGKSCKYEDLIKGMVEFQHKIFDHIGWKKVEEAKAA